MTEKHLCTEYPIRLLSAAGSAVHACAMLAALCVVAAVGADRAAAADILEKPPAWNAMGSQGYAHLGNSVAVAGDVDGDGYSDVIIGEYRATWGEGAEGRAYLYYGGPEGLDGRLRTILEENQKGAWLGYCVASAGDVNGDGYHDVLVGAPLWDNNHIDEGCVFLYLGSPDGLVEPARWRLYGGQEDARFGDAVSTAGDVNGDGYDDIIVGAPLYGIASVNDGRAFLFYGSAQGVDPAPAWEYAGVQQYADFGGAVATAGDVNGDGYADVLIGAPTYDTYYANAGRVFLFLGSDSGLADTPDWKGQGLPVSEARYGFSVGPAGDVNGDGYGDFLVGMPLLGISGGYPHGRFYLYYGSSSGTYYAWTDGYILRDARYGWALSTAGDVNGDGFADILIGSGSGDLAMAYLGSAGGVVEESQWRAHGYYNDLFGASVCTAGDVNGDGLSDVIIGAPDYDSSGLSELGRVYVYYGARVDGGLDSEPTQIVFGSQLENRFGTAVASGGDVNGDGCGDVLVGAYLAAGPAGETGQAMLYEGARDGFGDSPAWLMPGTRAGEWFGWSLDWTGDVNGDGYSDVLIGAPRYSNGEFDEGAVFLYNGSADGLADEPWWHAEGAQDGAELGFCVSRAGDVNGDGFGDILVGAYRYDERYPDEGRVALYYGKPWGIAAQPDWTACGGQEGAWFGYALAGAGDMNGDGYSDLLIGAPRYDVNASDEGKVFAYFGSPGGPSPDADWSFEGTQAGARFGSAVAHAGDINGDGFGDILIAAPDYISSINASGRVVGFAGSDGVPGSWPDWIIDATQRGSGFGAAIGAAGDINNDGYGDIFIGEPEYRENRWPIGRVMIYTGSRDRLSFQPVWECFGNNRSLLGSSVCAIRKVSGGTIPDLLVGAPLFLHNSLPKGAMLIYSRSEESFGYFVPRQLRTHSDVPIDMNGLSHSEGTFELQVEGRLPFGRSDTALEWEVKPYGTPFDGSGLQENTPLDPGSPDSGAVNIPLLEGIVSGLVSGQAYRWRARQMHTSPFLPPRTGWTCGFADINPEPHIRIGPVPPDPRTMPLSFTLFPNYPNPFNPGTTISYRLSKPAQVELVIYDALGRPVKTFPRAPREAGLQNLFWNGRTDGGAPAASGVYFLRIDADGMVAGTKLVLIR